MKTNKTRKAGTKATKGTTPTTEYYDSMRQASAATGYSISVLKRLKESGSKAFRGSRVYRAELEADVSGLVGDMQGDPGLPLRDQKLLQEVRKLKIANDAREGRLVQKALVDQAIRALNTRIKALCLRYENDAPMLFRGADDAELREATGKAMDEFLIEWQSFADCWKC